MGLKSKIFAYSLCAALLPQYASAADTEQLERDIIILHRKLNSIARKLEGGQPESKDSSVVSTADLDARLNSLEEKFRSFTGEMEKVERLSSARTNSANILKEEVQAKLEEFSSKSEEQENLYQENFDKIDESLNNLTEISTLLNKKNTVMEENVEQVVAAATVYDEKFKELYDIIKAQNNYIGDLTLSHKNALLKIKALEKDNMALNRFLGKINMLPDGFSSKVSKEVKNKHKPIKLEIPEINSDEIINKTVTVITKDGRRVQVLESDLIPSDTPVESAEEKTKATSTTTK